MRKFNFLKSALTLIACLFLSTSVMSAQETVTVYVRLTDDWQKPCNLYVWNDNEVVLNEAWPGTTMMEKSVTVEDKTFYYESFSANAAPFNIIFNNNNGGQTGDIKGISKNVAYYLHDGFNYTIEQPVLKLSHPSGVYEDGVTVTITETAYPFPVDIYFTTDGSEPDITNPDQKTVSGQTISISTNTVVKAVAVAEGIIGSETKTVKSNIVKGNYFTQPEGLTIFVKNENNWADLNLYAWEDGVQFIEETGAWPGKNLNEEGKIELNGVEYYTYTFDFYRPIYIIFNNGNDQTEIILVTETTAYIINEGNGKSMKTTIVDVIPSSIDATLAEGAEVVIYPNPAVETLNIQSAAAVSKVLVYNVSGALVAQGNSATLNVETLPAGCYIYQVVLVDGNTTNGRFIKR